MNKRIHHIVVAQLCTWRRIQIVHIIWPRHCEDHNGGKIITINERTGVLFRILTGRK